MAGERKPGVPSDEEPTVVRAAGSVGAHSCGSPPSQQRRAGDGLRVAGLASAKLAAEARNRAEAPKPTPPHRRKRPKRRSLTRPS